MILNCEVLERSSLINVASSEVRHDDILLYFLKHDPMSRANTNLVINRISHHQTLGYDVRGSVYDMSLVWFIRQ